MTNKWQHETQSSRRVVAKANHDKPVNMQNTEICIFIAKLLDFGSFGHGFRIRFLAVDVARGKLKVMI